MIEIFQKCSLIEFFTDVEFFITKKFVDSSLEMNKTAEIIVERTNLILDSFKRIEGIKAGDPLDLASLSEKVEKIKTMKTDVIKRMNELTDLADKTELISSASATYAKKSRKLLSEQKVNIMIDHYKVRDKKLLSRSFWDFKLRFLFLSTGLTISPQAIEKRINLKARNELNDIKAKIEKFSPVCMDSLDEIDIQEIEKLEKNKDDLAEKVIDFEKAFPDIEKWLKEFHRGNLKWNFWINNNYLSRLCNLDA